MPLSDLDLIELAHAIKAWGRELGFADVRMYFGSWNEWSRDDKLPIESGLPLVKFPKKPALALAA